LLKGSLGWLAKFHQTRKSGGYGKIISNKLQNENLTANENDSLL
jgi:hypothetical protein